MPKFVILNEVKDLHLKSTAQIVILNAVKDLLLKSTDQIVILNAVKDLPLKGEVPMLRRFFIPLRSIQNDSNGDQQILR